MHMQVTLALGYYAPDDCTIAPVPKHSALLYVFQQHVFVMLQRYGPYFRDSNYT